MKKSIYLFLLFAVLISACKKDKALEVGPKPEPETENPTKAGHFLKALTVTGVKEISFDSTNNSYMVSLPDTYKEEMAEVKLSMHSNIGLVDAKNAIGTDSIIRYKYQGTAPLRFELREKSNKGTFYFNVYFNFSGTPQVTLLKNEIPVNSQGIKFPLRFEANIGSIPSTPTQGGPIIKIMNKKTGFSTEAIIYDIDNVVNLDQAFNLITTDPLTLEVHFYNQEPVVFENVKFTRDLPNISSIPGYKFQYTYKDTITGAGGYFLPNEKYTVRFSNDFMGSPVTGTMRFNDAAKLTLDTIPANLSEGSYLISFYEKDKLLGQTNINVSNFSTNCLETIWKGDISENLNRNVTPLSFSKGDIIYAKSQPLDYGSSSTKFDVNRLPRLRLKSSAKTVDLTPELVVYNWAIAGTSYPLGKYKIPADLPAGEYIVSGVYTNRYETTPYWSKMKIK
jgi:hypothetical protein